MPLMAGWLDELTGRGAGALLGLVVGAASAWLVARWRLLRERRRIFRGDARDTVVIAQHLVEAGPAPGDTASGRVPRRLRIRSLGQAEVHRVVPNGHLAAVLRQRALAVTPQDTLISMEGPEGSFLLETLTNFVCDRVANGPFEHDLYVMAPCCEPAGMASHQPITILLIAVADLLAFAEWPVCRQVEVEHGTDGARILTLRDLARRYQAEQATLARLHEQGQRTLYVETMYLLDLALDRRSTAIPTKPVAWGRFESVLKVLNLE
jgi:hypothetical protein